MSNVFYKKQEKVLLQECIAVLEEWKLLNLLPPFIVFHPINEGKEFAFKETKKNYIGTNKFGFLAGLADLVLCFKNESAVFVELKISPNKLSSNQLNFQKMCEDSGHQYYIIKDDVKNFIKMLEKFKI